MIIYYDTDLRVIAVMPQSQTIFKPISITINGLMSYDYFSVSNSITRHFKFTPLNFGVFFIDPYLMELDEIFFSDEDDLPTFESQSQEDILELNSGDELPEISPVITTGVRLRKRTSGSLSPFSETPPKRGRIL